MARRSGWTIVKEIARDIDRANRAQQRANMAHRKAVWREEERLQRQAVRERDALVRQGARLQEQFNRAINAANTATTLATKENKLQEAIAKLAELKQLSARYPFFSLNNLAEVEDGVRQIQAEVDTLKHEQERKKSLEELAVFQTAEAEEARAALVHVLHDTLAVNDAVDWEALQDTAPFAIPEPVKRPQPMMPPEPVLDYIPMKPHATDPQYTPRIPLLARLSRKKKTAILQAAQQQYEADLADWQQEAETLKADNDRKLQEWKDEKQALLAEWNDSYWLERESWERRRAEFIEAQDQFNADLSTLRHQYEAREKTAVETYCSLVLSRSAYPFTFAKDYQLEYLSETQVLALDYGLPSIDIVPALKEAKFIKTRQETKNTYITDRQRQDLYDNVLYAMVLRTIHELFEADTVNALASIILNGWVSSLDKGTGNEVSRCILTINVTRQEFLAINLANVDPRQCFKKLKGMSSAKLSDLVPVAPLLDLNREDRRFVQSYDVTGTIQEGDNLAVMHWEDFEHLIRELFEKEFGGQGGEVKVTQASRDGGVDAVIFDPDPIRGGQDCGASETLHQHGGRRGRPGFIRHGH